MYDTEVARGWDVVETAITELGAWDATWLAAGLSLAAGTGLALVVSEPRPSSPRRGSRRRGAAAPTFIPVAGDEPLPDSDGADLVSPPAVELTSHIDQLFAESDLMDLTAPAIQSMPLPQPPFPTAPPRRSWWAAPLLLLSALCLWNAVPASTATPLTATPLAAATPSATIHSGGITKKLRTTPIGEIRLGMRVLAENPELAGQHLPDTTIDHATWRTIALTMTKPDGGRLDMEFIRSPEWMDQTGTRAIGDTIPLDLPELNVSGPATVTAISPCPTLETGEGRLVTGRFVHESAEVLNLYVEGLEKPIGTTPNHPFWSEGHNRFIPAGMLRESERLRSLFGRTYITSLSSHRIDNVYNLEVDVEHVFFVGHTGVLVHNSYPMFHGTDVETALSMLNGGKLNAAEAAARHIDGSAGFYLASHLDDAMYFGQRRNGTVLQFDVSDEAMQTLLARGAVRRPIPRGGMAFFNGDELFIPPSLFEVLNSLLDAKQIRITPARWK